MEFNARYTLISAFAIAVLLALLGFIYWLNNSGGFGPRAQYQVGFSVPVSGMANGSNVLFNGLKVGEVTSLQLDPNNPSQFSATISIDANTPIREDTKAGVEYQGLTGAANVSLTGGSAESPKLLGIANSLPMLIAAPADSRSWTTSAARVLGKLDEMLSGDGNRLDTILAGLEKMLGGDEASNAGLYDLKSPAKVDINSENIKWQLVVAEPTVLLALNTDKILELKADNSWLPVGSARWSDNLPNLFQAKLIRAFENADMVENIARPSDVFDPEHKLTMDIRHFHYRNFNQPAVLVDLIAKIVNREGETLSTRQFKSELATSSSEEADIANKMSDLFSTTATEMINWAVDTIQ